MLTQTEAQKIADVVNTLRPDWGTNGLMTILGDQRIREKRIYRDTMLAFVALALDAESQKPTRIFEHGPWWETTRPAGTSTPMPPRADEMCVICNRIDRDHTMTVNQDHAFDARPREGTRAPAGLITTTSKEQG